MANLVDVREARDAAWDVVAAATGARPVSVGIVGGGGRFTLGVVLGAEPAALPPAEVMGVPVAYEVQGRPALRVRSPARAG